jgi:hypothetical protein
VIYAIKGEAETNEKMVLRYKKLFFQSRVANKLKTERYVVKKPTKKKVRYSAIVREHYRMLNNKVYF